MAKYGLWWGKKRFPERIAWDRALVQQFEDNICEDRDQQMSDDDDDWMIVWFEGELSNLTPLALNKSEVPVVWRPVRLW